METRTHFQPTGFIDLLLDAVCAVDVDGRFVFVSAACERIFGYTPQELVGRSMIDLVAPADRKRTLVAAQRIMAGDPQLHFENRYVRKDGELVTIMWTARWSEKDRLRIAVARDVTARRHAESMQAALYAISEATHAAHGLPDLCERIHRIIDDLLPARNFSVGLQEADGLSFPYRSDEDEMQPAQFAAATATLYTHLLRTGQPLLHLVLSQKRRQPLLQLAGRHRRQIESAQVAVHAQQWWFGLGQMQVGCPRSSGLGQQVSHVHETPQRLSSR